MQYEILDQPISFRLAGFSGMVENERYAEVGMGLMNCMWQVVKQSQIANTGINHWLYLAGGKMFVGVELRNPEQAADPLEPLEFELKRYLKHVHVGPYQALPQKWKELMQELATKGETVSAPSLEVYGHHSADESKQETTILIGLRPKTA